MSARTGEELAGGSGGLAVLAAHPISQGQLLQVQSGCHWNLSPPQKEACRKAAFWAASQRPRSESVSESAFDPWLTSSEYALHLRLEVSLHGGRGEMGGGAGTGKGERISVSGFKDVALR